MNEETIRRAVSEFNDATAKIMWAKGGKAGFGHEKRYGDAYRRLVNLGLKPKLRGKYRG